MSRKKEEQRNEPNCRLNKKGERHPKILHFPTCPKCKNEHIEHLVHGYPMVEHRDLDEFGKPYRLMGCVVSGSAKQWRCGKCSYEWNKSYSSLRNDFS